MTAKVFSSVPDDNTMITPDVGEIHNAASLTKIISHYNFHQVSPFPRLLLLFRSNFYEAWLPDGFNPSIDNVN
jgi:hypothetical protein